MRSDYYDGVSDLPLRPLPPSPPAPRPRRRRRLLPLFLLFLLLILAGCAALAWHLGLFSVSVSVGTAPPPAAPSPSPAATTLQTTAPPGAGTLFLDTDEAPELTPTRIYQTVNPAIVSITAFETSGLGYAGTGILFDPEGYLVTNAHVLEGTDSAWITLSDDREYPAHLVGMDTSTDLAVLKILAAGDLPAAVFAPDTTLEVGEPVYAIGNPLGTQFRGSMTDGIVSAIDRSVFLEEYELPLIQTSAALNEGNSGGALVDATGRVVGVTNMKMMSSSFTIEGVGFAIPSTTVAAVVNDLMTFGYVTGRPQLGITVRPASPEESPGGGLFVDSLFETSDAWAKGLRPGDILLIADGIPLNVNDDLLGCKEGLAAGDSINITWRSAETGRQHTADILLIEDAVLRMK